MSADSQSAKDNLKEEARFEEYSILFKHATTACRIINKCEADRDRSLIQIKLWEKELKELRDGMDALDMCKTFRDKMDAKINTLAPL
jgi:hypothetical protein